jgi:hypothetical protein
MDRITQATWSPNRLRLCLEAELAFPSVLTPEPATMRVVVLTEAPTISAIYRVGKYVLVATALLNNGS